MEPLDLVNHLVNFLVPALALGAVAAVLAKLAWRSDLATQTWWRMAWPAAAANVAVTTAGLVIFGRDGRMATYAAMVLATSLTLWWRGFGPGRR